MWTHEPDLGLTGDPGGAVSSGQDSFDDFVRREQAGLVRFATLLSGSQAQAEDLVQDVLVRVFRRWDGLQDHPGSALAYVRRAVTNEHISWRRRWHTRHVSYRAPEEVPDVGIDGPGPADDRMWQALLALPPQQRAAVVLRYYEDLTDGEIADVLGCRQVTVRSNISRGLAALRARQGDRADHGRTGRP